MKKLDQILAGQVTTITPGDPYETFALAITKRIIHTSASLEGYLQDLADDMRAVYLINRFIANRYLHEKYQFVGDHISLFERYVPSLKQDALYNAQKISLSYLNINQPQAINYDVLDQALGVDSQFLFSDPVFLKVTMDLRYNGNHRKFAVYEWLHQHWSSIQQQVDSIRSQNQGFESFEGHLFNYFNTGFISQKTPVLAQKLNRHNRRLLGKRLIDLDEASIESYIDIPEQMRKLATPKTYAAFSDYLRVALVSRYGGGWLDSSCLVNPGLLDYVDNQGEYLIVARKHQAQHHFFAPYFFIANQGNLVLLYMQAAFECYMLEHDKFSDYYFVNFVYTYVVARLRKEVPESQAQFDRFLDFDQVELYFYTEDHEAFTQQIFESPIVKLGNRHPKDAYSRIGWVIRQLDKEG